MQTNFPSYLYFQAAPSGVLLVVYRRRKVRDVGFRFDDDQPSAHDIDGTVTGGCGRYGGL